MVHGREQLMAWIDRMKLTDRAAAKMLGMHWTFLSQILNREGTGRYRGPSLRTALRLYKVTGIPVESWATDVEDDLVGTGAKSGKRKVGRP